MRMSRPETVSDDPLLEFCSEQEGAAAKVSAGWRLPDRPRMPEWAATAKSELAGLPASDAITGIAILSAVVFVGAFALTPRPSAPPVQLSARVLNDVDLTPAGKAVATTGGNPAAASARPPVAKRAVQTPVAVTRPAAAAPAPLAGWLTVTAAGDFKILENGQLIGSTAVPRITLPAGRHKLVIGNPDVGYMESRTVDVAPGRTTTLSLLAPNGRVNINARPWANVSVDGRSLGQTPLADVTLSVGRHAVVFQHPQYGERRETVVVTANGVAHVGVDFAR